jgi:hypothetical protein
VTEAKRIKSMAILTVMARELCKDDPGMAIPVLTGAIVTIAFDDLPTAGDALIAAAIVGLRSSMKPAASS